MIDLTPPYLGDESSDIRNLMNKPSHKVTSGFAWGPHLTVRQYRLDFGEWLAAHPQSQPSLNRRERLAKMTICLGNLSLGQCCCGLERTFIKQITGPNGIRA